MGSILNYGYYSIILWKKNGKHKYYTKNFSSLALEDYNEDFDYLLFLKFDSQILIPSIDRILRSLESIYNENQTAFIILTPRKDPPLYTASEDELVYSFSCKVDGFKTLINSLISSYLSSTNLLFELIDHISNNSSQFPKIFIRQIPFTDDTPTHIAHCDIVIPHRGNNTYLKKVLYFLNQLDKIKVHVGIDQKVTEELIQLKEDYPHIPFYNFYPSPVGPYIIRNHLIIQSKEKVIFFQDSDDIPCADRFMRISNYMEKDNCQLCGSHELRMDYYTKTIRAIRFPMDVTAALRTEPWHSLLHPTSAITREGFYECGKLSEERIFGNDTKFLLYCSFILKNIKNINDFYYIRLVHPDSLTTSPETKIGSDIRRKLLHQWHYDFQEIKSGNLKLRNSRLRYEDSKISYNVNKL